MSKQYLPLIGTKYKTYDKERGVAFLKDELFIKGKNDQSPRVNGFIWFKNKNKPTQIR